MFGLSGVRCHKCGIALENAAYVKNEAGEGLYWINPKISDITDLRLDFCGPICSAEWYGEVARKDVTQGN